MKNSPETSELKTCDDCGACCREISYPPFLWFEVCDLPADLQSEILKTDWNKDGCYENGFNQQQRIPCCWLDNDTGLCKNHKYRPQICKDFEINNDLCLAHRKYYLT